ncbi:hypothetical protein BWQ96_03995 [Gracilariopsis chorda]|uniref:MYND-type domain-containing protein n=1 Tax=Gracilariopsis chorda TaxID=448386 RepID=A0A2V3IYJ9_9FLOR|nr:hypothetical protein BWQ96_03995 [Gracilariopsis chorda]|eukprot:PXF46210.1 hypothetical protein BWQ96_03995 [Gracilariopsis chorda]
MTRGSTGLRAMTRNAKCAKCQTVFERLLSCSDCGSVAYCGRSCQRADWRFHAPICRTLAASNDADTNDGHEALLFDRAFGGFLSLVQRRMFLAHGHGVLVATLSAPPAQFRASVQADPNYERSIALRFVPQAAVPTLDLAIAAASGKENCSLIEQVSRMSEHLFSDVGGRYPGQMYTLVIRTSPSVQCSYDSNVSLMINWLSPVHPAHAAFSTELRFSDDQLVRTVFNWDTKQMIPPRGFRLRVVPADLVLNIIGEQFYNECIRKGRRRKARLKKGMPIEESDLYPPFAQSINIQSIPVTGSVTT